MSEEVITSESELYNQIVEMLSNGNFLQLNGKAISLTELNEYINAKQEEIERLLEENEKLNNIINELEKWLEEQHQFIIEIPAYTKGISIEHITMKICYENILDKLQELKGSE